MLEQVESTIIAFLLGSVMTYFATRWSKILKKLECTEFGVRALIRNRMIQTVNYYREKKKLVPGCYRGFDWRDMVVTWLGGFVGFIVTMLLRS